VKKLKNKVWRDRHARIKGQKEVCRRRRYGYDQSHIGKPHYLGVLQSTKGKRKLAHNVARGKRRIMIAPTNFSLYQNPGETLEYIESVKSVVMNNMPVKIEMKSIEVLSIDTIMYFLAVLKRLRFYGVSYSCGGDLPDNEKCKYLLRASGFLSHVNTRNPNADLTHESDVVRIISGKYSEPKTVKKLCDFVISKLNFTRIGTMDLYIMIMELMSNTRDHAYININKYHMLTDWYVFVYCLEDKKAIRFIFLDTGDGIPATIRKKLLEPTKTFLGLNSHTDYIESALEGIDLRSRSGESYRGNGLPTINSFHQQGYIKDLTIISNRGYFGEDRQDDLDSGLEGTLFYWEISQE
jgi:hypothetical protein